MVMKASTMRSIRLQRRLIDSVKPAHIAHIGGVLVLCIYLLAPLAECLAELDEEEGYNGEQDCYAAQ